jgi:cytosine/adenosine deaminase-related metal-dependent hydrolase
MIITAPKLLTLQPGTKPINNGAVVFSHGIIQSVGPARDAIKKFPSHRVYSFKNAVLMPGLVNLHAHLELPNLLERVCAKTFPDWIINLIKAKKGLSKKNYQSATSININTLIQTGTTTVGEICTHGVSPALLKQSGIRSTVFHEIISMNPSLEPDQLFSLIAHSSSRMREGLSPHSPYTVSESALSAIHQFARKKDARLSMHIAESNDEVNLLQRYRSGLEKLYRFARWNLHQAPRGKSSFNYLERIGFLSPRLLAVHAVHVTKKDIELIKKSKVSIAHCPRSNKETGVGKMPLKKFLDAGIIVGLGTDSLASSPTLSLWDEMRYAYHIHRRSGVSAEDYFRIATINGAKALGMDKEIGTLEPGKKADMIVVPSPGENTGDLYSDLLRETKSCIMTMVNGKMLYNADVIPFPEG